MSTTEWVLFTGLGIIYIALIATLAVYTYRKGHYWLFWLGFLVPILWMIGAIIRPKPDSKVARDDREYWSRHGG